MEKMDFTKLNTRIKFVRESNRISKTDFARRLEISCAYVTALEYGEKTKISAQLAKLIQYEFGINMKWMLEGNSEPFFTERNIQSLEGRQADEHEELDTGDLSAFERLLSEVSATYINLPVNQLEKVLKNDFWRISKSLGVDACILYMNIEDSGIMSKAKAFVGYNDVTNEYNENFFKWLEQDGCISAKNAKYSFDKFNKGEHVPWVRLDDGPDEAQWERQFFLELGLKSGCAIPIMFDGCVKGVIGLVNTRRNQAWSEDMISRLRIFGEVFINALMRKRSEEKLHKALCEIKELKEQFEADYRYLREEIKGGHDFEGIVGKSEALKKILVQVKRVAPTNTTVLILGETGTGKGLIARAIHDSSSRRDRPLMQVNCAALAPSIIESELFGHEKGSFTGAATRRLGRFEAARGTTLFLDEIGDLPLELQPKLLRALEEGEFERVGGNSTIHTDIRLIAATSRDLEKEVAAGRFRSDLWYRLNIFPIFVPPLRERLDDIPLFVEFFVEKYGRGARKRFKSISSETTKLLQSYSWPGNIRELSNVIERAVIESSGGSLSVEIPSIKRFTSNEGMTLKEIERSSIIKVLERTKWKIKGPEGAAQYLDIPPETLRSRMKKLGIRRPD